MAHEGVIWSFGFPPRDHEPRTAGRVLPLKMAVFSIHYCTCPKTRHTPEIVTRHLLSCMVQ